MRLGIDLDGVVADFNRGWIRWYNAEFGSNVVLDQVDMWNAIPRITHFRHMADFWEWASELDGHSIFHHLEPYAEALPAMRRLALTHDLVIITTKPDFAVGDTLEWIGRHRLPTREVHITRRKWTVQCDVYLDDGPHVLRELVRRRPDAEICRFVRPWNSDVSGSLAVTSWADFERVVERREVRSQGRLAARWAPGHLVADEAGG